jgi:hypothetical protein
MGSEWLVFNRTDILYLEDGVFSIGTQSKKVVEHVAVNYMPTYQWQLAGHLGLKFTDTETSDTSFLYETYVIGSELRYDLTPRWDVGGQYHLLATPIKLLKTWSLKLNMHYQIKRM